MDFLVLDSGGFLSSARKKKKPCRDLILSMVPGALVLLEVFLFSAFQPLVPSSGSVVGFYISATEVPVFSTGRRGTTMMRGVMSNRMDGEFLNFLPLSDGMSRRLLR